MLDLLRALLRPSLVAQMIESACSAGDLGLIPGSGRSPGEGNGNPFPPGFLPGKFHGVKRRGSPSPWGCKELDTPEWLTLHFKGFAAKDTDDTHMYMHSMNTTYRHNYIFLTYL